MRVNEEVHEEPDGRELRGSNAVTRTTPHSVTASGRNCKMARRSKSMTIVATKAASQSARAASKKSGIPGLRKKTLIGVVSVLVVVLVVVGVFLCIHHTRMEDAGAPLSIDGSAVSMDEFQFAVDSVKNAVLIEKAPNGSSVGPDFWADTAEGSASYTAAEKAVEVVKQRDAFYQVVADAGVIDSPSWEALYERFEKENVSRQSGQSSGGTVYGLQAFDLPTFVTYEQGVLEEQYVSDSRNPGMDVTEDQIQHYFASKQWTVDDQPATLEQVRSNVVNDLRRSIFEEMVAKRQKEMQVSMDLPSLAAQVAGLLG